VKGRRHTFWYWLVPGMHIKRYLLLCAVATVLLVLAIFGLFQAPGPSWLQSAFTFIRRSLGHFLPPGAVTIVSAILCIVLLVISLLLLVLGLVLLARSVLTATTGGLPVEESGESSTAIVRRTRFRESSLWEAGPASNLSSSRFARRTSSSRRS